MNDKPALIQHLERLAERDDRGALAALRRGLGKPPGTVPATFPHVAPFVPASAQGRPQEAAYYMVASLFAQHPEWQGAGDFGWTFRQLGDHPSAEARFRALLECDAQELHHHLRHAVSLAHSSKRRAPVSYTLLLKHALQWDHPARWVQRTWASSYWGEAPSLSTP